jgi:hypothetical protein
LVFRSFEEVAGRKDLNNITHITEEPLTIEQMDSPVLDYSPQEVHTVSEAANSEPEVNASQQL